MFHEMFKMLFFFFHFAIDFWQAHAHARKSLLLISALGRVQFSEAMSSEFDPLLGYNRNLALFYVVNIVFFFLSFLMCSVDQWIEIKTKITMVLLSFCLSTFFLKKLKDGMLKNNFLWKVLSNVLFYQKEIFSSTYSERWNKVTTFVSIILLRYRILY